MSDTFHWMIFLTEDIEKYITTHSTVVSSPVVQADPRVSNILLPIRDGMMVVRKD